VAHDDDVGFGQRLLKEAAGAKADPGREAILGNELLEDRGARV
jgi:hypothetical protein